MVRLLVIDNHDSFVFNIVQLLREHPRVVYDLIREDKLCGEEMTRYDALLLSPGPGIPEEYPRMMRLIAEGIGHYPILGICLGHQAIAQHLGAALRQLPHPLHGHPAPLIDIDPSDPIVGRITEGSIVGRYHSWVVSHQSLPSSIIPTAYSQGGAEERELMAFRHCEYPIFGLQFHPESMITTSGKVYIEGFVSVVEQEIQTRKSPPNIID